MSTRRTTDDPAPGTTHRGIRTWSRVSVAVAAGVTMLMAGLGGAAAAPLRGRPLGDSVVVAEIPAPGYPEGIAVSGGTTYISSPAQFGHKGDAHILAFDTLTGAFLRDYPIPAIDPLTDHGLVGVALDGTGHLYVADIQRGIVRLNLVTGHTQTYASLPDLLPCLPVALGACSPTLDNRPAFPNDIVFDAVGNAYVSDSFQATIWRIPPGGGSAHIWYQDAAFDGALGANGVRFSPDGSELCVSVYAPPAGAVHCVTMKPAPGPGDRRLLRSYTTDGPDNIAFGQSGKLYVALATANQIAVIDFATGNELRRYSGPAKGENGDVAWDAPAGVAFDNSSRSLRVTNHALVNGAVNPGLFVEFDVYVNDTALPLHRPRIYASS